MIDSSLFGYDLPAGSYAAGDIVQLGIIDGPAVVRSGRGAALLKRVTVGTLNNASGSTSQWRVYIKNSDWVDPMVSLTVPIREACALDERNGGVQRGHDCSLTPNSTWEVYAVCQGTVTTTVANSIYALIDIDYPSISSIVDPDLLPGIPASIDIPLASVPVKAVGGLVGSTTSYFNVDVFKAGFEYALEKMECVGTTAGFYGFISISNAAGMGGLKRILPFASNPVNIRNKVEYASKLVKGPMDIGFNIYSTSSTTDNVNLILDFVKRRI